MLINEVTRILAAIEEGDVRAADKLLPLVYQELRQLAAQRLSKEMTATTPTLILAAHKTQVCLMYKSGCLQCLTGHDDLFKERVLDAGEDGNTFRRIDSTKSMSDQQSPGLEATFANQHAGHHRPVRIMPAEEIGRGVRVFRGDDTVVRYLDDLVDEQERRSMGNRRRAQ